MVKSVSLFTHAVMGRDCVATIRDSIFSVRLLEGALFIYPIITVCKFREIFKVYNAGSQCKYNLTCKRGEKIMAKNKWVSFFLCLFLGVLGIHKFYEGRILLGLLYLFTGGLLGVGVVVDLVILFFKPNPYCP